MADSDNSITVSTVTWQPPKPLHSRLTCLRRQVDHPFQIPTLVAALSEAKPMLDLAQPRA
jgi:hypothetical protein